MCKKRREDIPTVVVSRFWGEDMRTRGREDSRLSLQPALRWWSYRTHPNGGIEDIEANRPSPVISMRVIAPWVLTAAYVVWCEDSQRTLKLFQGWGTQANADTRT